MFPALILYFLFTVLSVIGAYWIGTKQRSRAVGLWAGGLTLLFFIALAAGLLWLLRDAPPI